MKSEGHMVNGLASSIAFTPVEGMELISILIINIYRSYVVKLVN